MIFLSIGDSGMIGATHYHGTLHVTTRADFGTLGGACSPMPDFRRAPRALDPRNSPHTRSNSAVAPTVASVVLTFTRFLQPRSTPRTRWRRCNATPNEQILALQCPCSPKGPPPSPLHGKPRSAHRRCGGCAPNRRIHRGVCPQSPSWLIAVQSSASKSRGELQRRLFEHRPKAHSCIFPASSTIRARRP